MPREYPPASFYFKVTFHDLAEKDIDVHFQSVAGLDVQMDTESYKEGGENRFEHVIPTRSKYSALTLKRGAAAPGESALTDWCIKAFKNQQYQPINLDVQLLARKDKDKDEILMYWKVLHAWPKSWKFNELNAEKSEVFIETLELNYNRYEFKK
ncbi:MAG: phage tail protein [Lewinellaceae bacterium]|nr:phage tail protein [Phaeodactylibacter sp.]MCB0612987.1 phage tail protein [Phaeodactylibacter sp.]MCB9351329.1 phage tail protein [Lewinellaceae bacterium]